MWEASALHGSYWQNADDKAFTGWFCSMQKAPQILQVRTTFSSNFRRPKYHVMDHLWLIPSTFHSTQIQQSAGWAGSHRQSDQKGIWRVKKREGRREREVCQRYMSVTQLWAMNPLAEGCIISSWDTVFCSLAELKQTDQTARFHHHRVQWQVCIRVDVFFCCSSMQYQSF